MIIVYAKTASSQKWLVVWYRSNGLRPPCAAWRIGFSAEGSISAHLAILDTVFHYWAGKMKLREMLVFSRDPYRAPCFDRAQALIVDSTG
jgi:hypothetical protein